MSHSCPICDAQSALRLDEAARQRALLDLARSVRDFVADDSAWPLNLQRNGTTLKMRSLLAAFVAAGGKL